MSRWWFIPFLSIFQYSKMMFITGWWFGTFFIFPYIGNNHPNWLSYFSEGWPWPTNQMMFLKFHPIFSSIFQYSKMMFLKFHPIFSSIFQYSKMMFLKFHPIFSSIFQYSKMMFIKFHPIFSSIFQYSKMMFLKFHPIFSSIFQYSKMMFLKFHPIFSSIFQYSKMMFIKFHPIFSSHFPIFPQGNPQGVHTAALRHQASTTSPPSRWSSRTARGRRSATAWCCAPAIATRQWNGRATWWDGM